MIKLGRRKDRPRNRREPTDAPRSEYFSYHSNRLTSEATTRQNTAVQPVRSGGLSRFGHIFINLIVISIVVYILSLGSNPKVIPLSATSETNLLRSQAAYRQAASQILSSSILNSTKFTINAAGVESALKQQFPELESVALTIPLFGHQPNIQLAARHPAIWLLTTQGSFVLDDNGLAMIHGEDTTGLAALKLTSVNDETSLPVKLGEGVLTRQEVTFINGLVAQLAAAHIQIESLTLPPVVNQLNLKAKNTTYYVKFDMQNDPRTSSGVYLAAKQRLESDHAVPVEYLDVRLNDRVYSK